MRADRGGNRQLEVAAHRADVDEVLAPRGEGRQAVEELVQRAAQRPYSMPLLVGVRVSKIGKKIILKRFGGLVLGCDAPLSIYQLRGYTNCIPKHVGQMLFGSI